MNRLGIEMLTLLGMGPVEHVKLAADLGCVSISTGLTSLPLARFGYPDLKLYPAWSLEDDANLRRELKSALRDTGVHIGLGEGFAARPDADVKDRRGALDLMADLGARRINAISLEPDAARAHDQLASMADMVIARGMKFSVEFAPTAAIANLADALAVVRHVGADRCQVLIDAMHFFRTGGSVEQIEGLDPKLIGYAQMCDAPLTSTADYMRESMFARAVPGSGELPLREWVTALPADVEIGLEVPRIDDLIVGMSPRDHAARVVAAARELGA